MENQNNEIDLVSELKKFNDSMLSFCNNAMLPFIKTLKTEMKQLKMAVQGLKEANHQLSRTINRLEEENHRLSSKVEDLQDERRKFEGSCVLLGSENKALEKNIEKIKEMNFERNRY